MLSHFSTMHWLLILNPNLSIIYRCKHLTTSSSDESMLSIYILKYMYFFIMNLSTSLYYYLGILLTCRHCMFGHFIYQFHFRITEVELQSICYKERASDLIRLESQCSRKRPFPATNFFQRTVLPEIQDRHFGIGELDFCLLMS